MDHRSLNACNPAVSCLVLHQVPEPLHLLGPLPVQPHEFICMVLGLPAGGTQGRLLGCLGVVTEVGQSVCLTL